MSTNWNMQLDTVINLTVLFLRFGIKSIQDKLDWMQFSHTLQVSIYSKVISLSLSLSPLNSLDTGVFPCVSAGMIII